MCVCVCVCVCARASERVRACMEGVDGDLVWIDIGVQKGKYEKRKCCFRTQNWNQECQKAFLEVRMERRIKNARNLFWNTESKLRSSVLVWCDRIRNASIFPFAFQTPRHGDVDAP